jgi:hypothetical protein
MENTVIKPIDITTDVNDKKYIIDEKLLAMLIKAVAQIGSIDDLKIKYRFFYSVENRLILLIPDALISTISESTTIDQIVDGTTEMLYFAKVMYNPSVSELQNRIKAQEDTKRVKEATRRNRV